MILLVVTALATAYGAAVTLSARIPMAIKAAALLLYLVAGVHLALIISLSGGALVIPGRQINPGIIASWQDSLVGTTLVMPWLSLIAILAHILLMIPRPDRKSLLRPLPATIAFLALFAVVQAESMRGPARHIPGVGPDRVAYLTIVPQADDSRQLVIAEGAFDEALLEVRYVHETRGEPPKPRVYWTKDGAAVIFRTRNRNLLALGLDGTVVGALPESAEDWPQSNPNVESVSARRRFSKAQMEVSEYIARHGGIFIP